jgi:predicted TIM-barrel fold metal-dependent hydrolase
MIAHGVFTRHPQLKAVSIENGSYFVHRLIKRLKKAANNHPNLFPVDPVDQLRDNVWIAPYYEDDLPELASAIGVEKILFGSDWPHGEGLENPVSFTEELVDFNDADIRKVMRDNALDLLDVKVGSVA